MRNKEAQLLEEEIAKQKQREKESILDELVNLATYCSSTVVFELCSISSISNVTNIDVD